jgi:hypothetical protein
MSWHATALFIKADYSMDHVGLLSKLGFDGAEGAGEISFDDAASSSNDGVAIGTADGWTILVGSLMLMTVDPDGVAAIAESADVFEMILEGASDTAGFTCYSGGKLKRDWMSQEGEVIKDEGAPLPEEKKAFGKSKRDGEQAVLALAEALTLPYEKWESAEYTLYELPEDAPG